jgi:DNA polymerase V
MSSFDALPNMASVGQDGSLPEPDRGPTASAGFGSPGADRTVKRIDLNDALVRHPQATFMMRTAGGAMCDAGIDDGDVLIVDRALAPHHGNVIVAVVDGELICRRLFNQAGVVKLEAAATGHCDIVVGEGRQLEVWGVVTTVIKSLLD